MIVHLTGTVVVALPSRVVIDVGGVGYEVIPTPRAIADIRVGSVATIQIFQIFREDSQTLYGFVDQSERAMFETLQKVAGVGPKLALTILAATTPDQLALALSNGDESALIRIPGVGKKSAARLILELADRLPKPAEAGVRSDVTLALLNLGWNQKDIDKVWLELGAESEGSDAGSLLKLALSRLGKGVAR